jgi:hypothetical protein
VHSLHAAAAECCYWLQLLLPWLRQLMEMTSAAWILWLSLSEHSLPVLLLLLLLLPVLSVLLLLLPPLLPVLLLATKEGGE